MKRAFLRKVKPISCSRTVIYSSAGESAQAQSGVKRRTRTSAAMVGLAMSMGATGLLIPRQGDQATAAEFPTPEASSSSHSRVATLPSASEVGAIPSALDESIEHVVREGQTLRQLAERYRLSVEALATANDLKPDATLRVGQVLKVPVSAESLRQAVAQSPQLVATADLERLPALQETEQTRAERERALSRLEQQRTKLKNSLAELRREESSSLIATAPEASAASKQAHPTITELPSVASPAVELPSVAVLPSPTAISTTSEPDWMRANQSLLSPANAGSALNSVNPNLTGPAVEAPENLAVRPTTVLPNSASPLNANPLMDVPAQDLSYRVNPGDTVAQIARAHNITQAELISANRLSNPNVIFVGQVLQLPEAPRPEAIRPEVRSNQPLPSMLPASTADRSTVLPGMPSTQPDANSEVAVVPSSLLPAANSIAPTPNSSNPLEVNPASATGVNPYVQSLLSEVRSLREQRSTHRSSVTASTQSSPAQPTQPTTLAAANTSASSLRINPQLAIDASQIDRIEPPTDIPEAVRVPARSTRVQSAINAPSRSAAPSEPTVVAAAPLGSESYAPLLEPITGRMVSPNLPSLPDADKFLPDSALDGYIWPARGLLTSGYGWRWGRMHQGIDIAADIGTPIYAAATGVVEYAGWNSGGYGNMIEIRHPDGSMTRYAHLNAIYVQNGQRIRQSDQIGEMGSTGYSTGPHLHFEVHLPDQGTVNPMAYLPSER